MFFHFHHRRCIQAIACLCLILQVGCGSNSTSSPASGQTSSPTTGRPESLSVTVVGATKQSSGVWSTSKSEVTLSLPVNAPSGSWRVQNAPVLQTDRLICSTLGATLDIGQSLALPVAGMYEVQYLLGTGMVVGSATIAVHTDSRHALKLTGLGFGTRIDLVQLDDKGSEVLVIKTASEQDGQVCFDLDLQTLLTLQQYGIRLHSPQQGDLQILSSITNDPDSGTLAIPEVIFPLINGQEVGITQDCGITWKIPADSARNLPCLITFGVPPLAN